MESLKDKVVLITGASSGIGAGIAVYLAQHKCRLALTGRDGGKLQDVVQQCMANGIEREHILPITGDITRPEDRRNILEKTISYFERLDVLVNNAGISIMGTTVSTTSEQYDSIMDTNVKSLFFLSQMALPHLVTTKGNIVNMSSICANGPTPEMLVYNVSKAAVECITRCMAIEFAGQGVRVNAVSPGVIRNTDLGMRESYVPTQDDLKHFFKIQASLQPLGCVGEAVDVAKSVAFLASDMASHITAEVLSVDGGRHSACPRLMP